MDRGVGRARTALVALLSSVVLASCGAAVGGTGFEWTAFDTATCPEDSDAAACYVLRAEVSGGGGGQGRCDVYALAGNGVELEVGASFAPLALRPGRAFEWLVELPEVDDGAFSRWEPRCSTDVSG